MAPMKRNVCISNNKIEEQEEAVEMTGVEYRMPAPLDLESKEELYPQWLRFKQGFKIFMSAAGLEKVSEARKTSIFLNCIGQPAQELYFNTLRVNEEEPSKLHEVVNAFDEYFKPKTNEVINAWQFNKRVQGQGESFDSYYTELRRIAKNCNFDSQLNRMLRDRIVVGIREQWVQQKLLEIKDLTLDKAVEVCRSAELLKGHAKVSAKQTPEVTKQKGTPAQHKSQAVSTNSKAKYNQPQAPKLKNKVFLCKKCGTEHGPQACPAFGQQCEHCNKYNHFKVRCKLINQIDNVEEEST